MMTTPAGATVIVSGVRPGTAERPDRPADSAAVVVGIGGARRNAAAAVAVGGRLVAACEQERLTRVRGVGLRPGALPAESVAAALAFTPQRPPYEVDRYATAEAAIALPEGFREWRVDHHFAHAAAAVLASPSPDAAVLVCDRHLPRHTTVWSSGEGRLVNRDWPAGPNGFASLYSECAQVFGLAAGQEHQLEALARLNGHVEDSRFDELITYRDGALCVRPGWQRLVADWLAERGGDPMARAQIAGAFQVHLGRLLRSLVADIRAASDSPTLCLGGGLFFNTYFTTLVQQSGLFEHVVVAPHPGNAGAAVGAAIVDRDGRMGPARDLSPFLGPEYDLEAIKRTLDNCKLSYQCLSEGEIVGVAVDALARGRLVGWFEGRMEWGPRALGHRSILASPLAPYVLDNLNTFLKHRQRYRAYGLSVPHADRAAFFAGPPASRYMEYEYRLVDPERFRHALPAGVSALRVQTISADDKALHRFERLHRAFGEATGLPVLVNTSFNGFSEPIVCSPRDAVRVFFGTGLDLLVLDRFVVHK
jgi:carbamoyltransferase